MSLGADLLEKLKVMNPNSAEFYRLVASYFWRRFRPNVNYGFFFIFLGLISFGLALIEEGHRLLVAANLGGASFSFLLGGTAVRNTVQISRILTYGKDDPNPLRRLRRLGYVAKMCRGDVVSTFVLTLPGLEDTA